MYQVGASAMLACRRITVVQPLCVNSWLALIQFCLTGSSSWCFVVALSFALVLYSNTYLNLEASGTVMGRYQGADSSSSACKVVVFLRLVPDDKHHVSKSCITNLYSNIETHFVPLDPFLDLSNKVSYL